MFICLCTDGSDHLLVDDGCLGGMVAELAMFNVLWMKVQAPNIEQDSSHGRSLWSDADLISLSLGSIAFHVEVVT